MQKPEPFPQPHFTQYPYDLHKEDKWKVFFKYIGLVWKAVFERSLSLSFTVPCFLSLPSTCFESM